MRIYNILMKTPIGHKKGELKVNVEKGKLTGFLSLFGNTELVEGTVDEKGQCFLKGKFVTLIKSVDFTAEGRIDMDGLRLAVKSAFGYYEIIGQSNKQGGEATNE